MSKRSRRYLILILVFVLFFDSILVGMYLMIDAKGDKTENQNRMGMGKVEQKVESVKAAKQKKGNSLLVLVNKDNKMPEDFHLPLLSPALKKPILPEPLLLPVSGIRSQLPGSSYLQPFRPSFRRT